MVRPKIRPPSAPARPPAACRGYRRMESTCPFGCIQISGSTHTLVVGEEEWEPTGGVQVGGHMKGHVHDKS